METWPLKDTQQETEIDRNVMRRWNVVIGPLRQPDDQSLNISCYIKDLLKCNIKYFVCMYYSLVQHIQLSIKLCY